MAIATGATRLPLARLSVDGSLLDQRRRDTHPQYKHVGRSLAATKRRALLAMTVIFSFGRVAAEILVDQLENGVRVKYLKVGDGECQAQGAIPVRGRAKRGLNHNDCRANCGPNCIGYSYKPCEMQCTVHGDPFEFSNLSEVNGWNLRSGGGMISATTGRCGAGCFTRSAPCPNGTVESGGVTVPHDAMVYNTARLTPCPWPFRGALELKCGMRGVVVLGGRCKRPCPPGRILDRSFEIFYKGSVHGTNVLAPCPGKASGAITMKCTDGQAKRVGGVCGYGCAAGTVKVGKGVLFNEDMLHEERRNATCPTNFTGQVTLECLDTYVTVVAGSCGKQCDAGTVNYTIADDDGRFPVSGLTSHGIMTSGTSMYAPCSPLDKLTGTLSISCVDGVGIVNQSLVSCERHCSAGLIGPGVKAVPFGELRHSEREEVQCLPGFAGNVIVTCTDGRNYIEHGECYMHCASGSITSNGVSIPHDMVHHGENVSISCPAGTHSGTLIASCSDGQMKYNGTCGANCLAGEIQSNGAVVNFPMVEHGTSMDLWCPSPWVGNITVSCLEADVFISAFCGRPCPGGRYRNNGALVVFEAMNHSMERTVPCGAPNPSVTFSGEILLSCFDGVVDKRGFCKPDCGEGRLVNTGSDVWFPALKADEVVDVKCEPSDGITFPYGTVSVSCILGVPTIVNRTCGAPCPAYPSYQPFKSLDTLFEPIELPVMYHSDRRWYDCPASLSGRLLFRCDNGRSVVDSGGCGWRCEAESHLVVGASFVSPRLDHLGVFKQPCTSPFQGLVIVTCFGGNLNVSSHCRTGCFAGTAMLPSGTSNAPIDYPDMEDTHLLGPLDCPESFSGIVTMRCLNGSLHQHAGGCHADCIPGTWSGGYFDILHYDFRHDELVQRPCPVNHSGAVTLRCASGNVERESGMCYKNCQAGRVLVRVGVTFDYWDAEHDTTYPTRLCPQPGFVGSVKLWCDNGQVSVKEGSCNRNCQGPGVVEGEGAAYLNLAHGLNATLQCPESGTLDVLCNDGIVQVISGHCIRSCPPGQTTDARGILIRHDVIAHNSTTSGVCMGFSTGLKGFAPLLYCRDGQVELITSDVSRCYKHCRSGVVNSTDGYLLRVNDDILHGQSVFSSCPNGVLGTLTIECSDGILFHVGGACGDQNCAAGTISSGDATLEYTEINNGMELGPLACPADFNGESILNCDKGEVTVGRVLLPSTSVKTIENRGVPENYSDDANLSTLFAGYVDSLYDESEEDPYRNGILLCECCVYAGATPGVAGVASKDQWEVVWWAGIAGGGGALITIASGLWWSWRNWKFARKKKVRSPENEEEGKDDVEVGDTLAVYHPNKDSKVFRQAWAEEQKFW
eukprot:TRINITY_DN73853_c0_g1_i1.p1 TRINITY_DN73853_c0_g1~~TRINITY_DN73853_c0_g1_i1.p1  ORF type:complete len:1353 (-),score=117.98 TRINITY_DN73853_c0_g1_i1:225-4283(-)